MKKVVVLGAGYASLAFLKKLQPKVLESAQVTLISRYDYHYTSILLHEIVSGAKSDVTLRLKDILPNGVEIIKDNVLEIKANEVVGEKQSYEYDYLIVGLGFGSDDFGIQGVREHSTPIVDFVNAKALKEKLIAQIQKYKQTRDANDLKIAVCGGGFSGIETISSLVFNLKKLCQKEGVSPNLLELTCIEAMPDILPMFSAPLVTKAKEFLQNQGVRLAVGCKILRCEANKVIVEKDGAERVFDAGVIIWTAGVRGSSVIEASKFFTSGRSKVEVSAYLQPINQENQSLMGNVYVIGDCAALKDPVSGRFYPPTAQIAIKQGEYLAEAFNARLLGGNIREFSYEAQGTICSLGESYAIGIVGKREVSGFVAIVLKRLIEKKWVIKLLGLRGLWR